MSNVEITFAIRSEHFEAAAIMCCMLCAKGLYHWRLWNPAVIAQTLTLTNERFLLESWDPSGESEMKEGSVTPPSRGHRPLTFGPLLIWLKALFIIIVLYKIWEYVVYSWDSCYNLIKILGHWNIPISDHDNDDYYLWRDGKNLTPMKHHESPLKISG